MSKYLRIGALAVPMFFLLTLAAVAFADGNSGFASLEIGIGSRECALGDAGTAGAVGPQAMYWNPALNGWAESFGASFSYANWLQGSSQSAIFAIRPTPIGVVGFGATAFNAGQLEYRDDYPTDDPIGYFTPIDYSLYLSLTRALDSRVSLGVNGRYYYERIADYSARGFGTDVGLAFKPLDGMKLGFAVLDLGSSMAFIHEDFSLPLRTVAGISYTRLLGKSQVSASADAGYRVFSQEPLANAGIEFVLNKTLALRAGYQFLDQNAGLTAGLGLKIKGFRLEYSFAAHDLALGATQQFALGLGY